jgi:lipocalin-like protein
MKTITFVVALLAAAPVAAETLAGQWKIVAAEDLRADGTVARYPWGRHPIGSIVVQGGSCYLQIMSSDVPNFSATDISVTEQMKASLLSSYIAYTGPCTFDDAKGTTTMKVEGAWRPDYVGTEQTRFYRFEGNKMLYGPAPGSGRGRGEALTRRLTLERP